MFFVWRLYSFQSVLYQRFHCISLGQDKCPFVLISECAIYILRYAFSEGLLWLTRDHRRVDILHLNVLDRSEDDTNGIKEEVKEPITN